MNPERGPPYSLLSRASIFLLFPSSLRPLPIYSLPLCLYECTCVSRVEQRVCVCAHARVSGGVCMYVGVCV